MKVPNPTRIEHALELGGFKMLGHPTVMWPFVLIECVLDPALGKNPSDSLVAQAAPALNRWRKQGVSWNQVGSHLVVFIRQKGKAGRPAGPDPSTEAQARQEFELWKAGLSYQQIRNELYPPRSGVEIAAIRQRVKRYAERHGLSLK